MKRKEMIRVEDLMSTAVIALREADELDLADAQMKLAEIRHIPVVDRKNHVIGVLSDRDVLRAFARTSGDPLKVSEIMTRHVRTTRPDMPAHEAATIMIEKKIGCLPVVGDDEQLVGIVTETDFVIVAQQTLAGVEVTRAR